MREGQLLISLPDQYYVHIGAIVSRWATLEFQMMVIIWKAMGLENEEGRVLTVGMGTIVLCGILRNLTKKWIADPALIKDVEMLTNGVSDTVDMRNYLAHGIWTAFKEEPNTPYLNFMKEGKHRLLPVAQSLPPPQLAEIANAIHSLNLLAASIVQRMPGSDAVPTSQEIPA